MCLLVLCLKPENLLDPNDSFRSFSGRLTISPVVERLVFSKVCCGSGRQHAAAGVGRHAVLSHSLRWFASHAASFVAQPCSSGGLLRDVLFIPRGIETHCKRTTRGCAGARRRGGVGRGHLHELRLQADHPSAPGSAHQSDAAGSAVR